MEPILCKGFTAAGIHAGIKSNRHKDLGLIYSLRPADVAGVFTTNQIKAPSVLISQERVARGRCRALIANSGNANCCNGPQGYEDGLKMGQLAARALGIDARETLIASTGVIGTPMPVPVVEAAIPRCVEALSPDGFAFFAEAIMTTDTVPKLIGRQGMINGRSFSLVAAAKGSGMIRPDMATMLCLVCTDAAIPPDRMQPVLKNSVDQTLNRISVDGDTSTNDMMLLMANGASGALVSSEAERKIFSDLLLDLLKETAFELVADAEGGTKVVRIETTGAASTADARKITETVAHSPLVKTAIFGEDPNWGRIVAAVGRAGVPLNPETLSVYFNDAAVFTNGRYAGAASEESARSALKAKTFTIRIDLALGAAAYDMLTPDLSVDYVRINADYRS